MEYLEQKEQENPFDLEIKQKLIHEYRAHNAFVEAAQVKERYLEIAPLPEQLWIEWLSDFNSMELYRKALKDYPCKS